MGVVFVSGQKRSQTQLIQSLQVEYQAVEAGWRFFSGLRFAVLSFAATIQFGLFGGYQYVFAQVEAKKLSELGFAALWVIPAFSMIATLVIALIERRAQTLYLTCLERGIGIEAALGIPDGHFSQIKSTSRLKPYRWVPYTRIIWIIHALVGIVWFYLFLMGVSQ
ncbi:MAG: hypothetical protein AAB782_00880 [Patescibacteria group bacterium]